MKTVSLVMLFILITFAGCGYGESPYFNIPSIESQYDFHVRYFARGWDYDGYLAGGNRDFYAEEWEWLQEFPEYLERCLRRRDFCAETWSWRTREIRVISSVDELAEPNLTEYTKYFFQNNYLVMIELNMPHSSLDELVYRIEANGTILLRPKMVNLPAMTVPSFWTIIIELDNRFQPSDFNVVYVRNPWKT